MEASVRFGYVKFDEEDPSVGVVPAEVVEKVEASAHGKTIDAGFKLISYDSLVCCIRNPLWEGEVVEQPHFYGLVAKVIKRQFFL